MQIRTEDKLLLRAILGKTDAWVYDFRAWEKNTSIERLDSISFDLLPMLYYKLSISSAEALRALAPSSIFQLPYAGAEDFTSLASTLRTLPCFQLNLTQNIAENVALIRDLLR